MLYALKGTIVSVKADVTQSLQSLTSPSTSQKQKHPHVSPLVSHVSVNVPGGIDLSTGAELLQRYTNDWKGIHESALDLSHRASEVDKMIGSIHSSIDKQNSAMNHFLSEISALAQLLTSVSNIHLNLGKLEKDFSFLEKQLMELEDVCEEQEMNKKILCHKSQLILHQQRKLQELEHAKALLAAKHQKKSEEMEKHIISTLRERQRVFAFAHQEQMQNYKQFGRIEGRIGSPTSQEESIGIENVVIEDNIHELERFLEDLGIPDSPVKGPETVADSAEVTGLHSAENCNNLENIEYFSTPAVLEFQNFTEYNNANINTTSESSKIEIHSSNFPAAAVSILSNDVQVDSGRSIDVNNESADNTADKSTEDESTAEKLLENKSDDKGADKSNAAQKLAEDKPAADNILGDKSADISADKSMVDTSTDNERKEIDNSVTMCEEIKNQRKATINHTSSDNLIQGAGCCEPTENKQSDTIDIKDTGLTTDTNSTSQSS